MPFLSFQNYQHVQIYSHSCLYDVGVAKRFSSISHQISQELLRKGAINLLDQEEGQYLRRLLLVPKKNGNQRPVVNLKQDGTSKLSKRTFDKRDYMYKLELKNARFYIPLNMKRYEPIIQEICSILAGRQLVRVRRPLFWTKFSTSNFC